MKQRWQRLSRREALFVVLAAVYIVSPMDLIPELITGPLGLTDDVAAAALIAATFRRARPVPAPTT